MLKRVLKYKTTIFLAVGLLAVLGLGWFVVTKVLSKTIEIAPVEDNLVFDPEGPFALLLPRRDGNALILNIKRVAGFDEISYEMAYQSENSDGEKIDRGVTGKLNLGDKKSEYSQEILFGTCSKGDTFSTLHCVFDKNVENGNLSLHIKKRTEKKSMFRTVVETKIVNMNTTWHLQKPDVSLGKIVSADTHFNYSVQTSKDDLSVVGFSIVNDLTGMPKLPEGKTVSGKVYGFSVPTAKHFPGGEVKIELSDKPTEDAKIAQYVDKNGSWNLLDTKLSGNTLSAAGNGEGIYAVFVDSSK